MWSLISTITTALLVSPLMVSATTPLVDLSKSRHPKVNEEHQSGHAHDIFSANHDTYTPAVDFGFDGFDGFGMIKRHSSKSGYYCSNIYGKSHYYDEDTVQKAATKACKKLTKKKKNHHGFPRLYTATTYDNSESSYFEYPVRRKKTKKLHRKKKNRKSYQSVIINERCGIVDVVAHNKDQNYRQCSHHTH